MASDSNQTETRVVKIGGSLLEFDQTPRQLLVWLARQPAKKTVWIVGGGKLVDDIRNQDRADDPVATHFACIDAMDTNSKLVSDWLPNWHSADHLEELASAEQPMNLILSPSMWVRQYASHLPCSWDVTSDSIAAAIASAICASELVLLKSGDPPSDADFETLIDLQYVDRFFEQAVIGARQQRKGNQQTNQDLRVRLVNLRSPGFRDVELA